jgi:type I restriction enzyme S subunit
LGLYDGPHGTPPVASEGPIFLGIGNITEDGHLDLSTTRHIAPEDFPKWTKRVIPCKGDIVFTYEATLNRYAIIHDGFHGCLGRRLALIRPDPNKVNARFLHYYFFSADWRATVERNRLAGATVDRIPLSKFPTFPVNIPEMGVQRRIAETLSAYDDLIEVNQRRIAILEDMSRRLFDEWFVRFRYPGHEAVRLVETELGMVPEGWSVRLLGQLSTKVTDGSHWSPASHPAGKLMASVKDMGEWGFDLSKCRSISDEDFDKLVRNDCLPLLGDILVAKDGANLNKHTFLITEQRNDLVVLSSIAIIRPNEQVEREYLTALLKSPEVSTRIKQSVSGAAIPRIILKDFKNLPVIVPSLDLQSRWVASFGPLAEQCRTLTNTNECLRAARDLLLPKLISGQIDVSAAEETFAEAAE